MFPQNNQASAATDMVAALDTLRGCPADAGHFLVKSGLSPDEAAADFAGHHAGVPATPRGGPEPAVLYRQGGKPDLLLGLYGCDKRIRSWLPGLGARQNPKAASGLTPLSPVYVPSVHRFWDRVDLGRLPLPQITPRDAGRYITMGFVLAGGDGNDLALSAHRMLVLQHDLLGISMLASRHLRLMAEEAWKAGKPLPVSINIGVPPAAAVASATGTAHLPKIFDKLSLAGGLAKAPVTIAMEASDACAYLAESAFTLHGELLPETSDEALDGATPGITMPEFLGYDGHAGAPLHLIRIKAISQRDAAPFQAVIGPGREQSAILGLGGALSLALGLMNSRYYSCVSDLRFSHAGGGMLLLLVALKAAGQESLEPLARRMIEICPFVKTVVFVDDDVDLSSEEDVFWAMTTRANLAQDCHSVEGFSPMRMDPSQGSAWSEARGYEQTRCYIDATTPERCRPFTRRSFEGLQDGPACP